MSSEHAEQCAVIEWRNWMVKQEPRLALLHAITNGAKLPYTRAANGARYSAEAIRLISEGLTRGIPDLHLPVALDGCHSLYIEMKSETGTLTDDQRRVIELLREQGNRVEVCYGADQAIRVISEYLGLPYQDELGLPGRKRKRKNGEGN
jgi:hypothetical protein